MIAQLNLKRCPSCGIVTLKKDGCNHIKCTFCKKDWCYICGELFISKEEHYQNSRKACYGRMLEGIIQLDICHKCDLPTDNHDLINFEDCDHLICKTCFESTLINIPEIKENIYRYTFNCPIEGCDGTKIINDNNLINIILKTKDKNIFRKFRKLLWKNITLEKLYGYREIENYMKPIYPFFGFIFCLEHCRRCCKNPPCFFENLYIGTIIVSTILASFILPTYFQYCTRKFYYYYFLNIIKKELGFTINNKYLLKLIIIQIIIGEELLSLIFFISSFIIHYIYFIIFLFILAYHCGCPY